MKKIEPILGDYLAALEKDPAIDPPIDLDVLGTVENPDMTEVYKQITNGTLVEKKV